MTPYLSYAQWRIAVIHLNRFYARRFAYYVRLGAPLSRLINCICACHFSGN
jgi:hypothetical protein